MHHSISPFKIQRPGNTLKTSKKPRTHPKLWHLLFFPSVFRNDVHAFFFNKFSTAPRGPPHPQFNDKNEEKMLYKFEFFVPKMKFSIPFPIVFFLYHWVGGRGAHIRGTSAMNKSSTTKTRKACTFIANDRRDQNAEFWIREEFESRSSFTTPSEGSWKRARRKLHFLEQGNAVPPPRVPLRYHSHR